MKKIFALLVLVLSVASCGGFDTQAKVDEVLDIHDEVMPKMGELMNLKRKVLEKRRLNKIALQSMSLERSQKTSTRLVRL